MTTVELSGESPAKLDDMGRISLPRQLREAVEKSELVLLRGEEPCLWLYAREEWKLQKEEALKKNPSLLVRRRWNAQQPVELDRQGRILIPPTLREYARLSKDCIVAGQDYYIEIWAKERYNEYFAATGDDFKAVVEEQGAPLQRERGLGNGGNSAHPGVAGTDRGISGAEGGD